MASRQAISKLTQDIFGILPNKGIRTGNSVLKKRWTGMLEARYYPESITKIARKVRVCSVSFHNLVHIVLLAISALMLMWLISIICSCFSRLHQDI